jgi:hypothetical protein
LRATPPGQLRSATGFEAPSTKGAAARALRSMWQAPTTVMLGAPSVTAKEYSGFAAGSVAMKLWQAH